MVTLRTAVLVLLSQRYVPPPVAVRLRLGLLQVNVALAGIRILAVGGVVLLLITCESVAVQPLGAVTVTEYVPELVMLRTAAVELLFQRYVPPPVAVKFRAVVVQVNVVLAGTRMLAVGAVVLLLMTCESAAVQPFGAVTVTE